VHGGNLSFAPVPSFNPAAPEPRLSYAYDVTQQTLSVSRDPGWIAQLAVGQVRARSGFEGGARATVESIVECATSSLFYAPYGATRTDIASRAVIVSGKSGWLVETDITVSKPGLPFSGDHAIFIVVEDGDDWGLFFGAVPIGDRQLVEILDATVADLGAS